MAGPRKRYPSDHRRWFRVMEDILDDPKLHQVGAEGLGYYIRILATLNRQGSRDGVARLSATGFSAIFDARRRDISEKRARLLAEVGLISWSLVGEKAEITVAKYAELQYPATESLRSRSVKTPPTTPKTKTKTTPNDTRGPRSAEDPAAGNGKDPKPDARTAKASREHALEFWPVLVEKAARYGKRWQKVPGPAGLREITNRIRQGATREQLLAAIDGFVILHEDRMDDPERPMWKYLRATTIFTAKHLEEYCEAATPDPTTNQGERNAPTQRARPGTHPVPEIVTALRRVQERRRARRADYGQSPE